jgi:LysM repeat protein
MGMAMLVALPLLALILIRLLWSGSSLWFLTAGIILIGMAAVVFLARRPLDQEYARQTLSPESNRLPLVLAGLGVLFLAMLLLPNFSGGGDDESAAVDNSVAQPVSEVAAATQAPAFQPTAVQQPVQSVPPASQAPSSQPSVQEPSAPAAPAGSTTYVVQEGDTLWDIASSFGVTVDAIIAANSFANPEDLELGQEIVIPPPSDNVSATGSATGDEGAVAE